MNTIFSVSRSLFILTVPLFVTVIPLILLLVLSQKRHIERSLGLTALVALISTLLGLFTPFLGTWIGTGLLASAMPDTGPKCVTGAAVFLVAGVVFSGITFLIGAGLSLRLAIKQIGNT